MKKLILLGTAESVFDVPYDDPDYEIWGCGSCFGKAHDDIKRMDFGFEIHPPTKLVTIIDNKSYDFKRFGEIPIYVQNADDSLTKQIIPNAKTFPLKEVVEYGGVEFFTSTFCYMFVLAAMMGYKEIYFYKILLNAGQEYFLERPGIEYWIEKLSKKENINVYFPEDCELFFGDILYGYKERPNIYKIKSWRKHLWNQLHISFHNIENLTAKINKYLGALEMYSHFERGTNKNELLKMLEKDKSVLDKNLNTAKEQKEKYLQYFGALQNEYWNEDRGA